MGCWGVLATAVFAASLAGCEPDEAPSLSADGPLAVSFSDAPVVSLGSPDLILGGVERSDDVLTRVTYPRFGADGGILVPNDRTSIRSYAGDGSLRWIAGREGDGPGEFRSLWNVASTGAGIFAFDTRTRRLVRFSEGGAYESSRSLDLVVAIPEGLHVLRDGIAFAAVRRGPDLAQVGTQLDAATLFRIAEGQAPEPVLTDLQGHLLIVGRDGESPVWDAVPFTPATHLGAGGSTLYVVETGRARVHALWEDGSVRWIANVVDRPSPVTADLRERWCEARRCEGPGRPLEPRFPEELPLVSRIAVSGANDDLWLQAYHSEFSPSPQAEWWVLDSEGRARFRVRAPAELKITDIREGSVIGVFTDPIGIQTVRRYPIDSEGGHG